MLPDLFCIRKIPDRLPKEMQVVVAQLKKTKNKKACLRKAYDVLTAKYRGNKMNTITHFFDLFITDLHELWKRSGFMHCTTFNNLLRILLVKSGKFKDEDIRVHWTLVYFVSLHQYAEVKISEKKSINIDMWGKVYGIKFGDYAHGFHT
jgi:hypothetical protein